MSPPVSSDWLTAVPPADCTDVPAPLQELAASLATSSASRRSAVLWLAPPAYTAGPQWATQCLGLLPRHLGREVVATCEAQKTQRVPAAASALLRHILAVHPAAGHAGTWLWGLDALLARLPAPERCSLWDALFNLRQHPPLLLALPHTYREFGPAEPDRWLSADPCRGLVL
ncbi:hypothetical protein [Hymenobacter jejuensis]|uniref:Uncharacterized protein n=1 Tax=Hymenobacter jejuensis TaxID=2502781 RepID=A0A5B7ZYA7_9BACT|nr:hypothetical protein [Hymenobacter jejuensis]QDA59998.1 hypothetical protein FHG12_07680 [Hymenobacter jejuensis]